MVDGHTYAGLALFVFFLVIDAILYAFSTALTNLNDSEVDKKAQEGSKKAIRLKKLIDDPTRFSDTLDIVVFITNLVAGGYILGTIRKNIEKYVNINAWVIFALAAGMFVILIVFGVIIPKKCGRRSPNKIAYRLSGPVVAIIVVLFPITCVVTFVSHFVLRLCGIDPCEQPENVTEEEIITMVNEGQEQGVLEASEAEMIANIFELGDKTAGDIMTHRSSIVALDCHMTLEEVIQQQSGGSYSRFPVYDGDIDNIVGTLHIRDALIMYRNMNARKKEIVKLRSLLREPFFVPESQDIDDVLRKMQAEKVHMGIVVDEYGQTAGVISMEDIIEEIVGNIMDEYDVEEQGIKHNADDSYVVDGLIELTDLNKLLGTNIVSPDYETLNGYLISRLDRIPNDDETDEIDTDGLHFKILEVSQNVIRKVEISHIAKEKTEE